MSSLVVPVSVGWGRVRAKELSDPNLPLRGIHMSLENSLQTFLIANSWYGKVFIFKMGNDVKRT